MKFSLITLTCLASFAATVYSHPGTKVLGRGGDDDEVFRSALKEVKFDLENVLRVFGNYMDGDYNFPKASEYASENLVDVTKVVKKSSALSETGASSLYRIFLDLGKTAEALFWEFYRKRRLIQADSKCIVTRDSMAKFVHASDNFGEAFVNNTVKAAQDDISSDFKRYVGYLKSALHYVEGENCIDGKIEEEPTHNGRASD